MCELFILSIKFLFIFFCKCRHCPIFAKPSTFFLTDALPPRAIDARETRFLIIRRVSSSCKNAFRGKCVFLWGDFRRAPGTPFLIPSRVSAKDSHADTFRSKTLWAFFFSHRAWMLNWVAVSISDTFFHAHISYACVVIYVHSRASVAICHAEHISHAPGFFSEQAISSSERSSLFWALCSSFFSFGGAFCSIISLAARSSTVN